MYLLIVLSILFTFPLFCKTTTLRNRFEKAKGGEFIVTQKDKTLTLLTHHRLASRNRILLEEISVPKSSISFPINWQEWINRYAPGHHSWTLYEIDSPSGELISCFSASKGEWLPISGEASFLPKLLQLPLEEVSDMKKKRIGPTPETNSHDHRQIWAPLLIYDGKSSEKASFDVFETFWPGDDTELSRAHITLYFNKENFFFPFPYWMQVDNGVARVTIRIIDSGSELRSIFMDMPQHKLSDGAMQ